MELNFPKIEEQILKTWQKDKVFEKSLNKTKGKPIFVFFEGPPFANGLPGIHHLLARAFKDAILRYKTMRGFYVERKAGWDTHGLPTEMAAELSLGIKSKKDIEKDIGRFIKECHENVFTYKKEWEDFTERIGYWLDLENAYITCSNDYIESLWWILKKIWEKGLLYQDYKVVPYCPRCGTSLSSHEVAQGYETIKEDSVYVKFKVGGSDNRKFLVWTTTPWTLPANVALAVNPETDYVEVRAANETLILAEKRLDVLKGEYGGIRQSFKGKDLVGLEYEPLYNFAKPEKKAYRVIAANFVSTEEGTGIVHIAPAFGEDDMSAAKENDLPLILNVDEEGKFEKEVEPWAGKFVKDADPLIIEDLRRKDFLWGGEPKPYEHEYPFCWRCNSPLLYYAKQSWFIKVTAIKEELIENNKEINWIPAYLKDGRFGEWLNEVKDWNLSRERYWGTPLPIWQCQKCQKVICIGSIKELREKAKEKFEKIDLHRPGIDKVVLKCDCGGEMKRVLEVIDCWFDSGSMPFAQWHYPFENKDYIEKNEFFSADFICEGVDQTRGWFYTLLVISTLLGFRSPYKNVISTGIVLDSKGQKMSKSKGNVVKPKDIIDKYGADVARFYFYTVNQVGEPKRFDFKDVQVLYSKFFDTLINTKKFYSTYADGKFKPKKDFKPANLLDRWIISSLESLNSKVIEKMEEYDVIGAARPFEDFVDDLSNWYVRRSRKRFREGEKDAYQTLYAVLLKAAKLLAPFCPFVAEYLYEEPSDKRDSVHLEVYPLPDKKLINGKLEKEMQGVREIVKLALAKRAEAGIRVRQPLPSLQIIDRNLTKEMLELIEEEVNVKKITFGKTLKLETKMTKELEEEGIVRDIVRGIQQERKKLGLKSEDKIRVEYSGPDKMILEKNRKLISQEIKIKQLILVDSQKRIIRVKKI